MLGPVMRWMLLATGPMNLMGALLFAPPMGALRQRLGLPEADPFYLWIVSSWVFAFGVAYFVMGWTDRPSRALLAVGAWCKATFALLMLSLALGGRVSAVAAAGALPDMAMAIAFAWWLAQSPGTAPATGARG